MAKTFKSLREAAEAGYHGKEVNIEGKGLQKVTFADKAYDKRMSQMAGTAKAAPAAAVRRPDQQRVDENRAGRMMQTARDAAKTSNVSSNKAAAAQKSAKQKDDKLKAVRESNKPRATPAKNPAKEAMRKLGGFLRGGGMGGAQARAAADKRDAKKNSKR